MKMKLKDFLQRYNFLGKPDLDSWTLGDATIVRLDLLQRIAIALEKIADKREPPRHFGGPL